MGPWPEFGRGADTKNPSDCGHESARTRPGAWVEAPRDPRDGVLPRSLLWRPARRSPKGIPCLHWASHRPPCPSSLPHP